MKRIALTLGLTAGLTRKLAAAVAALSLVASVGVLAEDAEAGVSFPGGSASVDVFCHQYVGANVTRLWATNVSDRQISFMLYIENRTYPHLSGWQGWRTIPARESGAYTSSFDYGALVAMRTGVIRVYAHYALWNGSRWETAGEWLQFAGGSPFCAA